MTNIARSAHLAVQDVEIILYVICVLKDLFWEIKLVGNALQIVYNVVILHKISYVIVVGLEQI
jgi:hypothetical protein